MHLQRRIDRGSRSRLQRRIPSGTSRGFMNLPEHPGKPQRIDDGNAVAIPVIDMREQQAFRPRVEQEVGRAEIRLAYPGPVQRTLPPVGPRHGGMDEAARQRTIPREPLEGADVRGPVPRVKRGPVRITTRLPVYSQISITQKPRDGRARDVAEVKGPAAGTTRAPFVGPAEYDIENLFHKSVSICPKIR